MRFAPAVVLRDFTPRLGVKLNEPRISGLLALLDFVAVDNWTQLRQVAYFLATVAHETAWTLRPVRERRASKARQPALWAQQERYWPSGFYGRGYVQLTWERNYERASRGLAGRTYTIGHGEVTLGTRSLVDYPDLLLEPPISYDVAALGMRLGWFTGKKLGDYVREGEPPDYVGARRVVNGQDRAREIAAHAQGFELLLRASQC
jgi:putative chitinase